MKKKYETETARTLRGNFYMGDLLKFVNSEGDGVKLIKSVR